LTCHSSERIAVSKFPSPFGKPKNIPTPKPTKATPQEGKAQMEAGQALQKFLSKAPPSAKAAPTKAPPGGYKSGMSGQQYEGEVLKDYSAMKPKLATKDKILNPIKKAVGLPGKAPKMVPKK
jgi:hypothetical protein